MTIDEAITLERQVAKEQRDHIGTFDCEYSKKCEVWAEEHEQIAKWLEELKTLKENSISKEAFEKMKSKAHNHGYRQGYSKAINDVLELPKYTIYDTFNEFMNVAREMYCKGIDNFATLMKAAINHDWATNTTYGPITYNRLFDKCNEIANELKEMNK